MRLHKLPPGDPDPGQAGRRFRESQFVEVERNGNDEEQNEELRSREGRHPERNAV